MYFYFVIRIYFYFLFSSLKISTPIGFTFIFSITQKEHACFLLSRETKGGKNHSSSGYTFFLFYNPKNEKHDWQVFHLALFSLWSLLADYMYIFPSIYYFLLPGPFPVTWKLWVERKWLVLNLFGWETSVNGRGSGFGLVTPSVNCWSLWHGWGELQYTSLFKHNGPLAWVLWNFY